MRVCRVDYSAAIADPLHQAEQVNRFWAGR
jgi:hypothetical protein